MDNLEKIKQLLEKFYDGQTSLEEELHLKEGLSIRNAVHKAATIRLRPRLMTTITTIIGFTPLALNLGEGSDMLQPMAVGAIGGLIMEAFVALFFR